jgi:hypothetical protein
MLTLDGGLRDSTSRKSCVTAGRTRLGEAGAAHRPRPMSGRGRGRDFPEAPAQRPRPELRLLIVMPKVEGDMGSKLQAQPAVV